MPLEIKALRLYRAAWRRQMPRSHHPQPRRDIRVKASVAMQGHAHMQRRARRRHPFQHNPIQRQPQGVGLAAIDRHDAPRDRAVIAPPQHRPADSMSPPRRQIKTDQHQGRAQQNRPCDLARQKGRNPQQRRPARDPKQDGQRRLNPQRKIAADPHGQTHRHPADQMPPLCAHALRHIGQQPHTCPRSLHWVDSRGRYLQRS